MGFVKIIKAREFDAYFRERRSETTDEKVTSIVSEIITAVRAEGDAALRRYALRFEKTTSESGKCIRFEVPIEAAGKAWKELKTDKPRLAAALSLAADNLKAFGALQKEQFKNFEAEIAPGLFSGQRVIPVERAAVYVPAGRFPLISSALMGLIPAAIAGVKEKILVSPPIEGGIPDKRILAAAHLAGADRIFALGGAQAIAAFALGTETVPKADLVAGPGNKYVAAAKRFLFGEVGIDFVAGPTDVLIITDKTAAEPSFDAAPDSASENVGSIAEAADLIAADMLAQAEHDPDARARALVPDAAMADQIERALERRLTSLPTAETARASLEAGGLIVVYETKEEALRVSNRISPEHLELQVSSPEEWIDGLVNYGSLFVGSLAVEALGDYSAGINHTLPTSASARFSGGLSVRNFLKTVTTLRCVPGKGYAEALAASETIARAEGLAGHAESAASRYRLAGNSFLL